LIQEEHGIAARALRSLGVEIDEARVLVGRSLDRSDAPQTGQMPLTPRAKEVLERATEEATALGHGFTGTEHVLLALTRSDSDNGASIVLSELGASPGHVRERVLEVLSGD
jgi:ATP-dependent Clp protease ATP-binding subunit ClpC